MQNQLDFYSIQPISSRQEKGKKASKVYTPKILSQNGRRKCFFCPQLSFITEAVICVYFWYTFQYRHVVYILELACDIQFRFYLWYISQYSGVAKSTVRVVQLPIQMTALCIIEFSSQPIELASVLQCFSKKKTCLIQSGQNDRDYYCDLCTCSCT